MKLYATVTSERAMKGQGGQELHINVMGPTKEILWTIDVEERNGKICLDVHTPVGSKKNPQGVEYIFQDVEEIKGKRQKGEQCEHCGAHVRAGYKGCYCEKCGKLMIARI